MTKHDEDLLKKLYTQFESARRDNAAEDTVFKNCLRFYAMKYHQTNTTNPIDFPTMQKTETSNRFDLEQQILSCWQITDDIPVLEANGAGPADFTSLATVYEFKFQQLWNTFETLVRERKL